MKRLFNLLFIVFCAAAVVSLYSCTSTEDLAEIVNNSGTDSSSDDESDTDSDDELADGTGREEGTASDDVVIDDYDGETADDATSDVVGSDSDIYWEQNTFSNTVTVVYSDSSAEVTVDNSDILYNVSGGYVTIDMLTNSVKNVEIIASGSCSDGQLKIYGEKKFKLTLAGLDLTCSKGPAINDQCGKRVFVHLEDGTSNYLTDAATYSDEPYYHRSSSSADEDRKGCFFSEGHMIFSGSGALVVNGLYKHGIVTDGYFYMRPGVTLSVQQAAKNAIHVKGDEDDGYGIYVGGGYIYANVSSTAGKCIKTDYNVVIEGGEFSLNTSGGSEFDSDESDTSSASCIKADGNVTISDGTLVMKSTGAGGKGISSDGDITIGGGSVSIATSGAQYSYRYGSTTLTSSPKGIKADGNLTIDGGTVSVTVTGISDSSEGIESKATMTINDGEIYVYAYDDAINAATNLTINGGKLYCYAVNNDAIDSNGTLYINGGLVIAAGTTQPEEAIDTDNTNYFAIKGGTVIGVGGTGQTSYGSCPGSSSTQRTVAYGSFSGTSGYNLAVLDSSGNPLMLYTLPRTLSKMCLLFSSADLTSGSTYTIAYGGTISSSYEPWNGYYEDGTWSGGSTLTSFTSSSTVTTVSGSSSGGGNTGGGGNQGGGGPGGGGWW